jgi:hypothetical protein
MTIRSNTLEYWFPMGNAPVTAGTRYDSPAMTLYIPETASRTFRSVEMEVVVRDFYTTAASLTSWLLGVKLGAVAFNDVTTTLTITNSGDHTSFIFKRDVTSYFTTNFGSGASQTCQLACTIGAVAMAPVVFRLLITYDYDDAAQVTRSKTVRIPIESPTAQLTNVLTEIGSNQIPALDTFCPEASKTYRNIAIVANYNDGGNAVTNYELVITLDSEAEVLNTTPAQQALNTAVYGRTAFVRRYFDGSGVSQGTFDPSVTHQIKARSNNVTARYSLPAIMLVVTYEYDHSASTEILNSLVIPLPNPECALTNNSNPDLLQAMVNVQEPTTITLRQSGIMFSVTDLNSVTLSVKAGAQAAYRSYVLTAGSLQSGPYACMHRIDSGSAQGAYGTLARGFNTIDVNLYAAATGSGHGVSALMFLNYTSGKHSGGACCHNHSVYYHIGAPNNALSNYREITEASGTHFPESDYYVSGIGLEVTGVTLNGSAQALAIRAKSTNGLDAAPTRWFSVVSEPLRTDGEIGAVWQFADMIQIFNRYPGDPRTMMLPKVASRVYAINTPITATLGMGVWITYHSIVYTCAGNLENYSGDGSGVLVTLYSQSPRARLASANSGVGGGYSIKWYDDVNDVYVEAWQDDNRNGRSAVFKAGA